ncbi:MAG TPA: thioredoxin family protein [Thermoanaerobaculaceae bacterium]|nr:thioredoxin family protein [Thermoanaerobaculaceae bacterium]
MDATVKTIEVLGPGCPRCKETFRVVQHVVESAGLACNVVKNESIQRMIELGVMATPAVVIDGGVVISGRIPKADEVKQLLGIS